MTTDVARQLGARLSVYEAQASRLLALATDESQRQRIRSATKLLDRAVLGMRGQDLNVKPDLARAVEMALEAAAQELAAVQTAVAARDDAAL